MSTETAPQLRGREGTVAGIVAAIVEGGARSVLITGRIGVGKSAVAEAVAARLDRQVLSVPVDDVEDDHEVWIRLARSLGTTTGGRGIAMAVTGTIGARSTVVVLDGCEVPAAVDPVIDELLARCDDLVVLATAGSSADPVADRVVHLQPLDLPPVDQQEPHALRQSPAVALFVDRARRARADFDPTPDDLAAISDLCRRLDGLPLAITLAASRISLMEPEAMLRQMQQMGAWQVVGLPVDEEVARSVDHLDEDGRRTLAALGVFAGGASVDALHAVTGMKRPADTIAALSMLVDLDLVAVDRTRARYALTSASAAFVRRGTDDATRRLLRSAHAEHFLGSSGERRHGASPATDEELAIDHANRLSAVSWLRTTGAPESALELLVAMAPDFDRRGEPDAGRHLLTTALAACGDVSARTAAECHQWIGRFLAESTDPVERQRAAEHLRLARAEAARTEHEPTILAVLNTICENHTLVGCADLAQEALEEGLRRSRSGDHLTAEVTFLTWQAVVAHQGGDEDEAARVIAEAIDKATALDDRRLIVRSCLVLQGMPDAVRARVSPPCPSLPRLVELARADGDHRGEGWLLAVLTGSALDHGDNLRAASACRELLRLSARTGNPPLGRLGLVAVIRLAAATANFELAATINGALERHATAVKASMPPHAVESLHHALTTVENALGPAAARRAHDVGRLAKRNHILTVAEDFLVELLDGTAAGAPLPSPDVQLSPREIDVLNGLVSGQSNKEIAFGLGLRPKTVMHHCASIYRKLDVQTRAGAVAVALRAGIISDPAIAPVDRPPG